MAASFLTFIDHTQRQIVIVRASLDEGSARRRDLYQTTHNTHNRRTSMPLAGFEPAILANDRPADSRLRPFGDSNARSKQSSCVILRHQTVRPPRSPSLCTHCTIAKYSLVRVVYLLWRSEIGAVCYWQLTRDVIVHSLWRGLSRDNGETTRFWTSGDVIKATFFSTNDRHFQNMVIVFILASYCKEKLEKL